MTTTKLDNQRIRVTFYFTSGREQSSHDCDTVQEAFERCQRTGMDALIHPVGTTSGCYSWNPSKVHTIEGFMAKLAMCRNSAAEYSDNLIEAGICRPFHGRSSF